VALAMAGALLLAGCATRAPEPRAKVREATDEERGAIARALLPLMVVSGTWRGTQDGCAAALGVLPVDRINVGVAPSTTCKVSLVATEGALRNLPADELQAALAHELGHVRLGHLEARVQRRRDERAQRKDIESAGTLGGAIVTAIPVIGPLLALGVAGTQAAAEATAESKYRAYDRVEEDAADRLAADLLRRLPGGDERCQALVRLFERLEREGTGARWVDWLSTHPAPARRAAGIRMECAA
jgi:Zn-dependent protease with chaperone function